MEKENSEKLSYNSKNHSTTADRYLQATLIYAFKSEKSGHQYQVNVERYMNHLYCVKFFDLTPEAKIGKFSVLSGTYEPRTE